MEREIEKQNWSHRFVPTTSQCLPSCLINFLKTYIDFAYFLCLCPFRLVEDQETNQFIAYTCWPHTILCAVIRLLGVVSDISSYSDMIPTDRNNPAMYFLMLLNFNIILAVLNILKIFWLKKQQVVDLANFMVSSKLLTYQVYNYHCRGICLSKVIALIICIATTINSVAEVWGGARLGGYLIAAKDVCTLGQWISMICQKDIFGAAVIAHHIIINYLK